MQPIKVDCHAISDSGRKRPENEDQFLIADLVKAARIQSTSLSYDEQTHVAGPSHGKIMLVADGMGGHAAGRRASTVAVDEAVNYMVDRMKWHALNTGTDQQSETQGLDADLTRALRCCQQRIQLEASCNPDRRGMGTTLTIGIIDWPTLHVVHVGDSRCYLYRDGDLKQLTSDHTVAQAFVEAGHLSKAAGEKSRLSNALWNVVGGSSKELEPEVCRIELTAGDAVLLCTDGLTKHLDDVEIESVFQQQPRVSDACEELVRRANQAGGSDNVTVAIARFFDPNKVPEVRNDELETVALSEIGRSKVEHPQVDDRELQCADL